MGKYRDNKKREREKNEKKKDEMNKEKDNKKERYGGEIVEERHDENFYRLTSNRAKAVNGYSNMRPSTGTSAPWLPNFIFESFQLSEGYALATFHYLQTTRYAEKFSPHCQCPKVK